MVYSQHDGANINPAQATTPDLRLPGQTAYGPEYKYDARRRGKDRAEVKEESREQRKDRAYSRKGEAFSGHVNTYTLELRAVHFLIAILVDKFLRGPIRTENLA